jgi:hypothetical protein
VHLFVHSDASVVGKQRIRWLLCGHMIVNHDNSTELENLLSAAPSSDLIHEISWDGQFSTRILNSKLLSDQRCYAIVMRLPYVQKFGYHFCIISNAKLNNRFYSSQEGKICWETCRTTWSAGRIPHCWTFTFYSVEFFK